MTSRLPPMLVPEMSGIVKRVLSSHHFAYSTEKELQDGIERALKLAAIPHVREPVLSIKERPDFLVGDMAVEVKIMGSPANVLRQISRYMLLDSIRGTMLITTSMRIAAAMPDVLHGKVLSTHYIGGGF